MNNNTLSAFEADQISNIDEVTGGAAVGLGLGLAINGAAAVGPGGVAVGTTVGVSGTVGAALGGLGLGAVANAGLGAGLVIA